VVGFEIVDRYLLGDPVSKAAALDAVLAERSTAPAAAPFYRALEAVGLRAADEAFIALRLILAGHSASDENVRRLRALAAVARACATGDRAGLEATLRRDAKSIADLAAGKGAEADLPRLSAAARAAYARELEPAGAGPR
jgi:hypothetical protein